MYETAVEIYSDATNAAVMRHPDRRFPGLLMQGDTLRHACRLIDRTAERIAPDHPAYGSIERVRNALRGLLAHYRETLLAHGLPLPFEDPETD